MRYKTELWQNIDKILCHIPWPIMSAMDSCIVYICVMNARPMSICNNEAFDNFTNSWNSLVRPAFELCVCPCGAHEIAKLARIMLCIALKITECEIPK